MTFYLANSLIKLAIFNLSSGLNSLIPFDDWIDMSTEFAAAVIVVGAGSPSNRTALFALGAWSKGSWTMICTPLASWTNLRANFARDRWSSGFSSFDRWSGRMLSYRFGDSSVLFWRKRSRAEDWKMREQTRSIEPTNSNWLLARWNNVFFGHDFDLEWSIG